ncbi:COG1470 family protein [Streptomyces eurythermus]|uniref:COG1470 family protein n=1 Tax=Streptomyces eurythermus TaxID=42237 RepID=UPI0033E8A132
MPTAARAPVPPRPPRSLVRPVRPALPAVLAVLLTLAPLTGAPRAVARSGGWSVAPLGGGRPAFYAEGTPGAVLRDTVSVTNPGRTPVTVRLRGTGVPAVFARDGLRVPARTRAQVPFTVTVPRDAGPGDRTGAIEARDAHGRRATVPVRLRVGGPALAALTVEHLAVHADRITYDLVNRGTTVLVPKLAVRADGLFGRRVLDRAPRALPVRLPPGTRRTLSEPWPGRPVLDEVRVRLTVTAAGGARANAATSAAYVPWGAVGGGAAAVAGLLWWRARRPRRALAAASTGAES